MLTCTFGGTSIRLAEGPASGRASELNRRAAELAREAVGPDILVAGSLGPTGQLCEPLGTLSHDEAADAYAEQAEALTEGGADLLVLETMFCPVEAGAAIDGVRRATHLPFVLAFSFDRGTRTMMGTTTAEVVALAAESGAAAVGANCGTSLEAMSAIVAELSAAAPGLPLWVKPNAGLPRMTGDSSVYDVTPEQLGEAARGYVAGRRARRRRLLRLDARARARDRRGDQAAPEGRGEGGLGRLAEEHEAHALDLRAAPRAPRASTRSRPRAASSTG